MLCVYLYFLQTVSIFKTIIIIAKEKSARARANERESCRLLMRENEKETNDLYKQMCVTDTVKKTNVGVIAMFSVFFFFFIFLFFFVVITEEQRMSIQHV